MSWLSSLSEGLKFAEQAFEKLDKTAQEVLHTTDGSDPALLAQKSDEKIKRLLDEGTLQVNLDDLVDPEPEPKGDRQDGAPPARGEPEPGPEPQEKEKRAAAAENDDLARENSELKEMLSKLKSSMKERMAIEESVQARLKQHLQKSELEAMALREELEGAREFVEKAREKERASEKAEREKASQGEAVASQLELISDLERRVQALESLLRESQGRTEEEGRARAEAEQQLALERTRLTGLLRASEEALAAQSQAAGELTREREAGEAQLQGERRERAAAEAAAEAARRELREYKVRAAQALKDKEAEIDRLRAGVSPEAPDPRAAVLEAEVASLQAQCAALEARAARGEAERDALEGSAGLTEAELAKARRAAADAERALAESRAAEARAAAQAEARARADREELAAGQREAERLRGQVVELRAAHAAEVATLQRRLQQTAGQEELEQRLQTMADHLVQKQGLIGTLTSEKAALAHEVKRLREAAAAALPRPGPSAQQARDDHGGHFVHVEMQHASVPIRRMTTTMDAISLTVSRNMRTSPAFRYGLLGYLLLLHLWVYYSMAFIEREHHLPGYSGAGSIPRQRPLTNSINNLNATQKSY